VFPPAARDPNRTAGPPALPAIVFGVGVLVGGNPPTMPLQLRFESSAKTPASSSDGLLRKTIRRDYLGN
jgi:hypothetical protein